MMKIYLLIIVFLSLLVFKAQAQSPRPFHSIQSPNAAALKANVESPVTLDVGKVGLAIPIYSVEDKDLRIPLVLNYNSNGVKPDVHPGWVGQNWNLSAGTITRNIKGVPDEMYWRNDYHYTIAGDNRGSHVLPVGYCYNFATNQSSDWNSDSKISYLAKQGSEAGTFWKDSEPDEFIFSCGGYSGKFYFSQDGAILVQGHPDIKVDGEIVYNIPFGFDPATALNMNNPASFTSLEDLGQFYSYNRNYIARIMGFRIITPDGIQYEFGMYGQEYNESGTWDEVEFSADILDQYYFSEIFTTWHLKKAKSPITNAEINFSYERGSPVIQMGRNFSFYKMGGTAPAKGFLGWIFGGVSSYTQQAKEELGGRFVRATYLKYIETSDTRIDFVTSNSTELRYNYHPLVLELLDRSRYYSKNYIAPSLFSRLMIGVSYAGPGYRENPAFIQWAPEEYSLFRADGVIEDLYFNKLQWKKLDYIGIKPKGATSYDRTWNFSYTNSLSKRLTLLSLKDSGVSNPYIFTYNNGVLPGYNSMKIDHWGYYNNKFVQLDINNSQSLVDYKRSREPVDTCLSAGILTKVTFPTKGSKEFFYEPNKYKAIVSRNMNNGSFYITPIDNAKSGGGLRIRQVKESAGNGQPDMITTYEYSDGLLNGDIQYYWPGYQGRLFNGNTYTSDRFVTESLIPSIENTAGGIVSYQRVTERQGNLGRKEYDFTDFYTNSDVGGYSIDPQKSVYSPFGSKSFERGLLKEMRIYEENRILPLVKETYTYQMNPGLANRAARAVQSRGLKLFETTEINAIEGTAYAHYLYPYQRKSKQIQTLDKTSGTYFGITEEYTYDNDEVYNDNQLKEIKVTNSDGSNTRSRYKHTWDYTTGNLNNLYTESAGLSALYDGHIIDKVISSDVVLNKTTGSAGLIKAASLNTFKKGTNGKPVPHQTYQLETVLPVTSYTHVLNSLVFQPDSNFKLATTFNQYDIYSNPVEIERASKNDKQAYIWGHNGRFLTAAVMNSAFADIAYSGFEDNQKGNWSYDLAFVVRDDTAPAGTAVFNLSDTRVLSRIGLDGSKTYVLSYWVKGSAPANITGGTALTSRLAAIRTFNGWTQFQYVFNNATGINISGTSLLIDEVRLFPENALMSTYTYNPQAGLTSQTDAKGVVTYYDYDSSNRLEYVKDLSKNIVKKYSYNYSQENETLEVKISSSSFCKYREQTITMSNYYPGSDIKWELSGGQLLSGQGTPTIKILPEISGNINIKATVSSNNVNKTYSWVLNDATTYSNEDAIEGPNVVCGESGFSLRHPDYCSDVIWKTSGNIVMIPYGDNFQYAIPNFWEYIDQANIGSYGWIEAVCGCTVYRKEVGMFPSELFYTVMNNNLDYGGYACNNSSTEIKLSWSQTVGDYLFNWLLPDGWTYHNANTSSNGNHVFISPPADRQPTGSGVFYVEVAAPSCGPFLVFAYGFQYVPCGGLMRNVTEKQEEMNNSISNKKTDPLNKVYKPISELKLYNSGGFLVREGKGNSLNVSGLSTGKYELHMVDGDNIVKKEYVVGPKINPINKFK